MALDFLANALNVGTQAAGAHSRGKAAALDSERQSMLDMNRLQRQAEQDQIAAKVREREAQTVDLRDELLRQQIAEQPLNQRITGLQAQRLERELARPDLAPGTDAYYEHLRREGDIQDRFAARREGRMAARSQGASGMDNGKARQGYLSKRMSELTKAGTNPITGEPTSGLSPQQAAQQARQEWALISGEAAAIDQDGGGNIDLGPQQGGQDMLQRIQSAYSRAIQNGIDPRMAAQARDEALAEFSQSMGL